MAPLRLGIVGLSANGSWASRAHLPYIDKSETYRIIALCNSSVSSAEAAIKKYNLPAQTAVYDNVESLAKDTNVDVIVISVKAPEHYDLLKPAIEAKKDVFVEWPLAANLQQAEELTALAKTNGIKTMVGLQARQHSGIRRAKEMVANGELGQILGTTMVGHGLLYGPTVATRMEYASFIENGANLVTIPVSHAMDALCFVLGELRDLQATLVNNVKHLPIVDNSGNTLRTVDKTAHDFVSIQGTLVNGGLASVVYKPGTSSTGMDFYWEINGTLGSLVIEGPNGHIQLSHTTLKFVRANPGAKMEEIPIEVASTPAVNVGKAWDAYAGIGDGPVVSFEDALLRHRMVDAIFRSNERGTRETYL